MKKLNQNCNFLLDENQEISRDLKIATVFKVLSAEDINSKCNLLDSFPNNLQKFLELHSVRTSGVYLNPKAVDVYGVSRRSCLTADYVHFYFEDFDFVYYNMYLGSLFHLSDLRYRSSDKLCSIIKALKHIMCYTEFYFEHIVITDIKKNKSKHYAYALKPAYLDNSFACFKEDGTVGFWYEDPKYKDSNSV